ERRLWVHSPPPPTPIRCAPRWAPSAWSLSIAGPLRSISTRYAALSRPWMHRRSAPDHIRPLPPDRYGRITSARTPPAPRGGLDAAGDDATVTRPTTPARRARRGRSEARWVCRPAVQARAPTGSRARTAVPARLGAAREPTTL